MGYRFWCHIFFFFFTKFQFSVKQQQQQPRKFLVWSTVLHNCQCGIEQLVKKTSKMQKYSGKAFDVIVYWTHLSNLSVPLIFMFKLFWQKKKKKGRQKFINYGWSVSILKCYDNQQNSWLKQVVQLLLLFLLFLKDSSQYSLQQLSFSLKNRSLLFSKKKKP